MLQQLPFTAQIDASLGIEESFVRVKYPIEVEVEDVDVHLATISRFQEKFKTKFSKYF